MKKHMKKNTRKNNRHNGKNLFGQDCYTKVIKVEKETAMEQLMEVLDVLEGTPGSRTEYSLVFSDFTEAEIAEFDKKMLQILDLRSKMRGHGYGIDFFSFPSLAS